MSDDTGTLDAAMNYLQEHAPNASVLLAMATVVGALLPKFAPAFSAVGEWLLRLGDRAVSLAETMREHDPSLSAYFQGVSKLQRQLDRVAALPHVVRVVLIEATRTDDQWHITVHQQAPPEPDIISHWQCRPADDDYYLTVLQPIEPGSGIVEASILTEALAADSMLRSLYEADGVRSSIVRRIWAGPDRVWYFSTNRDTDEPLTASSRRVLLDAHHTASTLITRFLESTHG